MSTITTTPSVHETLFRTFREDTRKHDYRTARGKFFKHLSSNPDYKVTVGTAELLQENWNYNDNEERVSTYDYVPYNVLRSSTHYTVSEVCEFAEAYLREVAPTRKVYGTDYKQEFIIPNVVRIILASIYVEDRADGKWGDRDRYEAYRVLSGAIDPETDKVFWDIENVGQHHEWASNPFINEGDYRRDKDDISTLWAVGSVRDAITAKREAVASGQRTQRLIAECVEQGEAQYKYELEQSRFKCKRFLDRHEELLTKESNRPIEHAFFVAKSTAIKSLVDYYLSILGKTTWEVSSSTFNLGRRSYFGGECEDTPRFIDEVSAYALTIDWFIGRDSWDTVPEESRGGILASFRNVIRGF